MELKPLRKIILHVAVTLDGFLEGPGGELDWLLRDGTTDFADILGEILSDKDAIFYGRVSYEKWGSFVPPGADGKLLAAYERMHGMQKYVFSHSPHRGAPGVEFLASDILAAVNEIKGRDGKNIWLYGGAQLIAAFQGLDLIDEYKLAVHPVLIGRGLPLFASSERQQRLQLIDSVPHPSGVLQLHYKKVEP